MNAILSISCEELSEEALQDLTFEMINTINSETNLNASIVEGAGKTGDKGDLFEWGKILIEFGKAIISVAIPGVVKIIMSYIEREPSLKVVIKNPQTNEEFIIENLTEEQFKLLIERIRKSLELKKHE